MATILATSKGPITIPAWVVDFPSFRRWVHSDSFPDEGKICFINGHVWVDLSMEDFSSHNAVKAEIGAVLHFLMKQTQFGRYIPDGMRYSHPETELSTEPDGMVVSHQAFRAGRVQLVGGGEGRKTELIGSPEIIIEIVSESSEIADCEWALTAYYDAGISEYWLFDARRRSAVEFHIYKRGKKEFVPVRKSGGWAKSAVLSRSFRFTQSTGADGNPEYTLDIR